MCLASDGPYSRRVVFQLALLFAGVSHCITSIQITLQESISISIYDIVVGGHAVN